MAAAADAAAAAAGDDFVLDTVVNVSQITNDEDCVVNSAFAINQEAIQLSTVPKMIVDIDTKCTERGI